MKNFMHMTAIITLFACITTTAMEKEKQAITYHQATEDDTPQLLDIIGKYGIEDRDKIVILPKIFREPAIKNDILKGRLYCAKEGSDIVAFKKLFIINDFDEFKDILINEIRCGDKKSLLDASTIEQTNKKPIEISSYQPISSLTDKNSVYIYFGGDFTIPSHRNKGINSQLIQHAFETIVIDTMKTIVKDNFKHIVLLYGLTKHNAGENGGIDRTPSIVKAFDKFTKKIGPKCNEEPLYLSRYKAFMPTFDPEGTECKPLPDDQAIAGYGNVLQRQLYSTTKESK